MKRDIKFRVQCHRHNDRWEYYTLGDLVCGSTTLNNGEGDFNGNWYRYAGLKDKTGAQAYEGDIVMRAWSFTKGGKPKTVIDQIIYSDSQARFQFMQDYGVRGKGFSDLYSGHKVFPWWIIGNIYENPELLKPASEVESAGGGK